MGSSGEEKPKGIEESVGALVWVRRGNGCWWPGRVVGADELPESCLSSPKLGIPVKLLAKEKAGIEWYDLDKSARIKTFRCGEYEECIEKAKASAANPSKKAVRYARREDAILLALELEKTFLQSKVRPNFCLTLDKPIGEEDGMKKSLTTLLPDQETDNMTEELSSFEDHSNSGPEFSYSGVSFEQPNHISTLKEQSGLGRRKRTPYDSEDDGTEGKKRMKGLEDLGMGVVSSFKGKGSQVANVPEFLKKKNRRRQLTKVLESTAMVKVPVMCEPLSSPTGSSILGLSDSKVSGLESNESKAINNNSDSGENGTSLNAAGHCIDALLINCKQKENEISSILEIPKGNSSDKLFDVPFLGGHTDLTGLSSINVSCASHKPQVGAGAQSSQSSQVETLSLETEEYKESGSTSLGDTVIDILSKRLMEGTSNWHKKGKRNLRRSKKYVDYESNKPGDIDEFRVWGRRTSLEEAPQRSLPYRQSRFTMNPKYQSSEFVHDPDSSYLYDVELEVKTGYRPQFVPYISLMSKLNGQPIIGHPVTVEVVNDGFCDLLMGDADCYSTSFDLDEDEEKPNLGSGRILNKHFGLQPKVSQSPKSRKSGLLSRKIRKLSSLSGSCKSVEKKRKPVVEKVKGPAVACVPLKVVFSRINAALNCSIRPVMTRNNM